MPYSVKLYQEIEKLSPDLKSVMLLFLSEIERNREESVKRKDFEELRLVTLELSKTVKELAEAQKRTEERVNELAEAQRKTEERLNSLSQRVEELAEAQKKTEERLNSLSQRVEELAEAQKRTEERLNQLAEAQRRTEERVNQLAEAQRRTEERVNQLAEAQKKTEERLNSLSQRVEELAEAQKRTEERLNQLAEAQRRTEERVNQLAEAQKKTEETLRKLIEEHAETRRQLGGISAAVGYHLEDRAIRSLPKLLKERFGIDLIERPLRKYVQGKKGTYIEVNILAKGRKNGKELIVVGESKSQLSKKDVDEFIRKKLSQLPFEKDIFPILVTYMIAQHDAEDYAKRKGISVFYSYDFEL
ncbi:MAG: chordopoxvirus fusion protein [Candidatus Bathyarchaeia archaeon]